MSIPYWREVQYTDDGCSVYQCLTCYSKWEARSAPWWSEDGQKPVGKKGIWNLCPVCGVEWVGQIIPKEKKYFKYYQPYGRKTGRLYPCKFRIVSVYKDGTYISLDHRYGGTQDPEWIIGKLKELREKDNEDFLFNSITYHVEKENT